MKPRTVYLPEEILEQIDSRIAFLGYKSFAKYNLDLIQKDIEKARAEGSLGKERVVTPQDQYNSLVSDLASETTIGRASESMLHPRYAIRKQPRDSHRHLIAERIGSRLRKCGVAIPSISEQKTKSR